jgi:hypothetical protein
MLFQAIDEPAFIGCLSLDGLLLFFDDIHQLLDRETPLNASRRICARSRTKLGTSMMFAPAMPTRTEWSGLQERAL